MRAYAGLFCAAAAVIAAPAFAQAKTDGVVVSGPVSGPMAQTPVSPSEPADKATGFNLGFLDKLTINKGAERLVLPLGPIETDQLGLSWRPGGKWGITLDLTSRSDNDVLPREEFAAGAYYQITPRFRFGGGLTLNGDSLRSAAEGWKQKEGEAGVRLESAFSF
jgi:hypothetical protein